jgi:hypothetical protein
MEPAKPSTLVPRFLFFPEMLRWIRDGHLDIETQVLRAVMRQDQRRFETHVASVLPLPFRAIGGYAGSVTANGQSKPSHAAPSHPKAAGPLERRNPSTMRPAAFPSR